MLADARYFDRHDTIPAFVSWMAPAALVDLRVPFAIAGSDADDSDAVDASADFGLRIPFSIGGHAAPSDLFAPCRFAAALY